MSQETEFDKTLEHLNSAMEMITSYSLDIIATAFKDDLGQGQGQKVEAIQELRQHLSDLIRKEAEYKVKVKAFKSLRVKVNAEEVKMVSELEDKLKREEELIEAESGGHLTEIDLMKHNMYKRFEVKAKEVMKRNEADPTPSQLMMRQDSDNDLVVTSANILYKDPWTRRELVNPVRNRICGHVYEKKSVLDKLAEGKAFKCPSAGCGNKSIITKDSFIPDPNLKITLSQSKAMDSD